MCITGDGVRMSGHVCEITDHGGWRLAYGAGEMRDGRLGVGAEGGKRG